MANTSLRHCKYNCPIVPKSHLCVYACVCLAFIQSFSCKSARALLSLNSPRTEAVIGGIISGGARVTDAVSLLIAQRPRGEGGAGAPLSLSSYFAALCFLFVSWNSLSKYFPCSSSRECNCKLKHKEEKWENKGNEKTGGHYVAERCFIFTAQREPAAPHNDL